MTKKNKENEKYKTQANWTKDGWLLNAYSDDPQETIDLVKQMKELVGEEETTQVAPNNEADTITEAPLCPNHHLSLLRKSGKYGDFWGCSHYPECKYTIPIK